MIIHRSANEINSQQWIDLTVRSSTASFFQTRDCYDFYASLSFLKPFVYGISENGELVGLICGYVIADGNVVKRFFSRRAIVPGGVLIDEKISSEALRLLLQTAISELKQKAIYFEVRNYNDYSSFRNDFEAVGFQYQPHLNFHVATPDEETALMNLNTSKRRQVKQSLKTGGVIKENATVEEIQDLYKLLHKLYYQKVKLPLFPLSFFLKIQSLENSKIIIIKYNNKVVGGIVCVCVEKKSVYEWFVCGDDHVEKNLFPSVLATWAGIRFAANNGFERFDFMGAGKPDESYGVRDFKSKFGGELVEYGRFFIANKPILYDIGKVIVELILKKETKMNILIDIAHPAHVHLVKNTYLKLIKNGHNIFVTVKYVPSAIELLEKFEIPYIYIGGKKDSLIGKALLQINYNLKMWWLVISKKIDIGFGTSITIAHISRITKMHSIVLDDDDDDVEPLFVKYGHPFSDIVLSPKCVNRKSPKTIFYNSYHELAYLHPNCFTPNPAILNEIELKEGDCYFVVRFNSFKAHHDVGVAGLSMENKKKLIAYLESKGKVFITTEGAISDEFCKYQISISPEKIHSLIYYATMLIGDSQTMTSEASILGIPAIKCNSFAGKLSVPNELEERYHLCYSFAPEQFEQFVLKIEELLSKNSISLRDEFQLKRKRMLSEKLDITSFFVWFIENYPQSVYQTRNNSDLSSFL